MKVLVNVITKGKIFGAINCYMFTLEWEKCGLPHAHILTWLQDELHGHRVDDFISAELPDPEIDPLLFSTVKTQMVHGPCGSINPNSPCMKGNKCTKRIPRYLLNLIMHSPPIHTGETQTGQDGYPLYRHRKPEDG